MEDVLNSALDFVSDAVGAVTGVFTDGIGAILSNFFYSILYRLGTGLCWIINVLDQMFAVMSGLDRVSYDGKQDYLIKVFFGNSAISNVYWGMALIGIVLCFVFAIIAVARKAVDSGDKIRQSLGGILTGLFKGILIIICLTAVMNMVLTLSDVLLRQVSYLFDNADNINQEESIVFDDEEYAAMARVLDTIGNYSLNPSYNSRYNLNRCFNEIKSDLQYLKQRGVFSFYYVTDSVNGESWQSVLQKIVNAADLNRDLSLDIYNEAVAKALTSCMDIMRTDYSFKPLKSYTRQYAATTQTVPIDRMVFLMCTMRAAKNQDYNENASVQDGLRGAYYVGEKDFYDLETVSQDFELSQIDYIILFIVAFKMIWDLAVIIINCVARIFNMIFLYIIAPPFIATAPLDDGGKLKQWTTAFIVQCFSVFGSIIAMRVLLLFIPIVIDSKLVLLPNSTLNLLAKMVLILGGMSTAKRASSVVTGILADNAGMQAIHAGDMGDSVRQNMSAAGRAGVGAAKAAAGVGLGAAGLAWGGIRGGASTIAGLFSGSGDESTGSGTGGDLPKSSPIDRGNPDRAADDSSAPAMKMQDLGGSVGREWGSVEEFMASDGGFVPDAPDISQTPHYDEGRDWLPDGDVLTADSFTLGGVGSGQPRRTPPPPRPTPPGSQHTGQGEDSLPDSNRK